MSNRNFEEPTYKRWRIAVLKRDGYTCQMPDCGSKKRLNAHHIQKWASAAWLRFVTENGITLCRRCHDKIKGVEHCYFNLFTEIVSRKRG